MERKITPALDFQGPLKNPASNKSLLTKAGKKKVLFRAPVLTCSGYGVHARQIFQWLLSHQDKIDLYVETLRWGNTTWTIDPKGHNGLAEKAMKLSKNPGENIDISIQLMLPNEWQTMAKFNVGVTAAVESDRCNPQWVEAINKMNLVIVPSEHTKNVIMNSGQVTTKIIVIPESYIDEIADEDIAPIDIEVDTSFNLLLYGQFTGGSFDNDRKNTFQALKWICETYKNDKDVGIIIKTNSGRFTPIDKKATTQKIQNTLHQVRQGEYPKVYLLHGYMDNKEVASLYRHPSIKALIALTRGEGYGLPILEAAASGVPVIATDWSGHLDFLNQGRFIRVDYDLKRIPNSRVDNGIWMNGSRWAEPKEKAVQKILKKFRVSHEIPKEWALELQKKILEKYSHKTICSQYDSVLLELLTT